MGERMRILNGKKMDTREHAHRHIERRLRFPEWYGGNLDALHDCLGQITKPTTILVRNCRYLRENLGEYGARMIVLLQETTKENPNIRLILHE